MCCEQSAVTGEPENIPGLVSRQLCCFVLISQYPFVLFNKQFLIIFSATTLMLCCIIVKRSKAVLHSNRSEDEMNPVSALRIVSLLLELNSPDFRSQSLIEMVQLCEYMFYLFSKTHLNNFCN